MEIDDEDNLNLDVGTKCGIKTKYKLIDVKPPSNPVMLVFGAFLLWFGWFAFNVTSPAVSGIDGVSLGEVGLNTLLSPCASAICCVLYQRFIGIV